jgi:hypothetical protein
VTVEPVYLTNPREFALLQRSDFRDAIAQGVFNGVLAYDRQIEATRIQIERAEAAQAAQRRAAEAAAADAERTATAVRWGGILGAALLLWTGARFAVRRQPRQPQRPSYRRRIDRRRRSGVRRY